MISNPEIQIVTNEISNELKTYVGKSLFEKSKQSRQVKFTSKKLQVNELGVCECEGFSNTCEIILNPKLINNLGSSESRSNLKKVIYHEIGHAFNLPHSKTKGAIMSEYLKDINLSENNIKEFAQLIQNASK
jgi:predicted SprT family Zn-dependent metalloprotease